MSKSNNSGVPLATERVLSTLNEDGSRRWMRPKLSRGYFWLRRRIVGLLLIAFFVAAPLVRIGGKPAIFLDLAHREFTFFGRTFLATDTPVLMLTLLVIFLSIFWITAMWGRVWCGWGCPQTVYMEFVFRPIERLIEGNRASQKLIDKQSFHPRRILKLFAFAAIAVLMSNIFVAYFVGTDNLQNWLFENPANHPGAFGVVAFTSLLIFVDYAYFREQLCVVACPYARLQSALFDRSTTLIGYDINRGENRARVGARKKSDESAESFGDCIDCHACTLTCPTGIDIRKGPQLECVACAQCVDACDNIMVSIGKPKGLIRYDSQENLESPEKKQTGLRARVVIYPLLILIFFAMLVILLNSAPKFDLTILRGLGAPYVELDDGTVRNQLRIRIVNRSKKSQIYHLSVELPEGGTSIIPQNEIKLEAGRDITVPIFATINGSVFINGAAAITVSIDNGEGAKQVEDFTLLGP